ncbi:MAG: inorganic diphosphatase [Oceanipulchritudo sp.]
MKKPVSNYTKYKPHPWHGLEPLSGERGKVVAFIEVTQYDRIKFEIDPTTGYLCVDRPQRNSSLPPVPYGFIPRTLCGDNTGKLVREGTEGDGDALDICVLSEHEITRSEVVLDAQIIGALKTFDSGKADPKLIAILEGDMLWGDIKSLSELSVRHIDRLEHYFRQYKVEKNLENPVEISERCDKEEALRLLDASLEDYREAFSE